MSARALLVALLASPALQADVIVVDLGGGGDFTSVSDAVAAAADGDTILVHDGDYIEPAPVLIDGKGLTLLGEAAPDPFSVHVTIQPGLVVTHAPPGQHVVLQNLNVTGAPSDAFTAATAGLSVSDNLAQVRVQNCFIAGGAGTHTNNPHGAPGADVDGGLSVAFIHCFVAGGSGNFSPVFTIQTGDGGPGITFGGVPLLVSHCSVFGGWGGSNAIGGFADGGDGGPGLLHGSGVLLLVSTVPAGGLGGTSHFGGDGGNGITLGSSGVAVLLAGSGGSGGMGGSSDVGPNGANGQGVSDPFGIAEDFDGHPHEATLTSPEREGQVGLLTLGGDPGDTTLIFASLQPHQLPFVGYQGVLTLSPFALIGPFPIGSGTAIVPFVAPTLPVGVDSLNVHVQPAFLGADGTVLGPGSTLTLLDAAF